MSNQAKTSDMKHPKSNEKIVMFGPAAANKENCVVDKLSNSPEIIIENVKLKRSITFLGVVAILISNIGGTGIFITPTIVLHMTGSPGMSIIIWILGGIVQAFLAFCAVELALMLNKAGGPYYFICYTFGDMAGFVFMWGFVMFVSGPTWALGAYTTSLYTLSVFYPTCEPPHFLVKLVALWIMVSLIALNCTHMKVVTRIQSFLTSCKVVALVVIITIGLVFVPSSTGQENLSVFMEGTTSNVGSIALALFTGFFGFGGWQVITILAEEVKDPVRNIPRGLFLSFVVMVIVMVATNFAYYVVLSKPEALKSDAVAMLFAQMVHPILPLVISVLVSLCSFGTLNVLIMGQPRLLFAAGRNGHMPRIMTMLHKKYHTPWPATWTMGVAAVGMLATGSVLSLVASISLYAGLMTLSLVLCLLFLRWKQPDLYRPWKIPIVIPILTTILMVIILTISIFEEPAALVSNIIVILLGIPVYILVFRCEAVKKRLIFMDRIGFYLEHLFLLQYET